MEVVVIGLVIAVAAIAILGLFKTVRFDAVIADITTQLGWLKLELSRHSQSRVADAQKFRELADGIREQQAKGHRIEELLDGRCSTTTIALEEHGRVLAVLSQSAGELRAAVAELQRVTRQLRVDLEVEQHSSQAADAELRGEVSSLQVTMVSEDDRLQQQIRQAAEQTRQVEQRAAARVTRTEDNLSDAERRMTENARVEEQHFAGLKRDARDLERNTQWLGEKLNTLLGFVQRQLDDEAAGRNSVLVGGIHADQPAATDILPVFLDDLCRALSAEILFREPGNLSAGRFYLRWHTPPESMPRQQLRRLLRAGTDGDESAPGRRELHRLLVAICLAKPASVQLGPLVAVCTDAVGVAGLLPERYAGHLVTFAADHATPLGQLDPDCRIDLMSLAASYVS